MFDPVTPAAMEMLLFIDAGDSKSRSSVELLALYGSDDGSYRLGVLLNAEYLWQIGYHPNVYAVSPKGSDFLLAEKKRAEDEAERKREQESKEAADKKLADKRSRKDAFRFWVGVAVNIIIAFCSAIIGAVLAVRTDIVNWIVGLFH